MSVRMLLTAGVCAAGIGVAGCSVSVTTAAPTVAKSDVEKEVSAQLTQTVGQTPKSVACPGDLTARVGTTMRCDLTADDGSVIGLTVTVTSVEGSSNNVKFDIKVDDTVKSGPTS